MLGALYMGWYPEHWGANMKHPTLGYYDSRNVAVIKQHVTWARQAGIDFFVFDWFGPRGPHPTVDESYIDRNFRVIAAELAKEKFKFCLMQDFVFWDLSNEWLQYTQADLDVYFNNPYYYRIDGKPVCYLWSTLLRLNGYKFPEPIITRYIGDLLGDEITPGFDNSPTLPGAQSGGYTVEPRIIDRANGSFYRSRLATCYPSASTDRVVFTWNDFGEQDFIEPTQEYGGQYLNITRDHLISIGAYRYPIIQLPQLPLPQLPLDKDIANLLVGSLLLLGLYLIVD